MLTPMQRLRSRPPASIRNEDGIILLHSPAVRLLSLLAKGQLRQIHKGCQFRHECHLLTAVPTLVLRRNLLPILRLNYHHPQR